MCQVAQSFRMLRSPKETWHSYRLSRSWVPVLPITHRAGRTRRSQTWPYNAAARLRGRRRAGRPRAAGTGVRHGGLERNVALTPTSILEAGSVSKQFRAAAILLLLQDGKLSLDDPVRRWVPEVPDSGCWGRFN